MVRRIFFHLGWAGGSIVILLHAPQTLLLQAQHFRQVRKVNTAWMPLPRHPQRLNRLPGNSLACRRRIHASTARTTPTASACTAAPSHGDAVSVPTPFSAIHGRRFSRRRVVPCSRKRQLSVSPAVRMAHTVCEANAPGWAAEAPSRRVSRTPYAVTGIARDASRIVCIAVQCGNG